MNIKNLLMLASITLQFSSIIHAFSQDAYNAAFHAFDVKFNSPAANTNTYKASAAFISQHGNDYSRNDCAKISDALGTPEAKAVGFFLANGQISSKASSFTGADGLSSRGMSYENLQTAIAAAPNTVPTPQSNAGNNSAGNNGAGNNSGGNNSGGGPLSDVTYSPAVWARTLAVFGGGQAVYDKTTPQKTLSPNLSNENFYNNAKVLVQYFSTNTKGDFSGITNSTDRENLIRAFNEAGVNMGTGNNPADGPAAALKAQIDSSLALYNQYLQQKGQSQLRLA